MKHTQSINIISVLLYPLSLIYGTLIFLYNLLNIGYKAGVDVICVGNITMGGTGKTPLTISLIKQLKAQGHKKIVVVSRGYGGSIINPTVIDNNTDVNESGDEPQLIAKHATVVVSKNKKAGVKYAEKLGADIIVLDDGLQNPTVKKDKTIIAVDGYKGFGNDFVFPAGEKREFTLSRLSNADAIVVTGTKGAVYDKLKSQYGDKVYFGEYAVIKKPFESGQSVVPFSGLGNNEKFFETVRQCGYPIRAKVSYPDHYKYTDKDIADLNGIAGKALAKLITTEKDFVRLNKTQQQNITALAVEIKLDKKINL